jgi:NAD+--dinitrogen-reductase ADP-D-ribosyltransferase
VFDPEEVDDPRHWYATNLVGVSSRLLASIDFNDFPQPLCIAGTRETHAGLFSLLATHGGSQAKAADAFAHYMEVAFGVAKRGAGAPPAGEGHARSSYLKLLQGWGFDANGPPGAVWKGWVESRFGIVPTFHKEPLEHFPSPAWMHYLEEKLSSRFHNNCIQLQLDVLYEYCQWSLWRFRPFVDAHVPLFRGIDRAEARLLQGSIKERRGVIRLNNLVSFSASRERAEEFGELMVCAQVPRAKLVFFPGLIHDRVLNGEGEVLVIGGDFEVTLSYE